MSLITLTFGSKKNYMTNPHVVVSTPGQRVSSSIANAAHGNGALLVKKACRFYGEENIFVVAEVAEGIIAENMKGYINGNEVNIVEVESKYGNNAKKGMNVGVFLSGIDESALEKGARIEFTTA